MDENGIDFGAKLAISALGLLVFGIAYNSLVEHAQRKNPHLSAEFVVIGVLATVVVSAWIIGWQDALVMLALFAASGTPMIVGAWIRTARDNAEAKREMTK